jgi:hypothetical protein
LLILGFTAFIKKKGPQDVRFIPGRLVILVNPLAALAWVVVLLTAGAVPSAAAQQTVDAGPQGMEGASFSLQASVSERPRLTRDQVDPAAVGAKTSAPTPFGGATVTPVDIALITAPINIPAAIPTTALKSGVSQKPVTKASTASSSGLKAAAAAGGPDDLYSVDWSVWVTNLADRWFFNLKQLETLYRQDFHSPRAAQIRFTCYPNGTIGNISLEQSSGIPSYDQLQIQSLVQTMPLAPFPPGTQRKSVTLVQGWESHPRRLGEQDFRPGSFGRGFPQEKVNKWNSLR